MTQAESSQVPSQADLHAAWQTLQPLVRPPLIIDNALPALTQPFQTRLTIASESLQYTGSFKFRAAYNLLQSRPEKLIITASSGNFGQAVAYACQLLQKQCIVVMPQDAARIKIEAVQAYGGQADLINTHQISRQARIDELLQEYPQAFFAPAYNHPLVIAGNSTLARAIFESGHYDVILVPIGGGGLISGFLACNDLLYPDRQTQIIGAEPLLANDAARSLRTGQRVQNEGEPATLADGARTNLGDLNWHMVRTSLKEIVEVSEEELANTVRIYFRSLNLKVEPTGALTLAAYLQQQEHFAGRSVCCVVSGGNIDPALYARLIQG